MVVIIDVDTHWEATTFGAGEHPLEPWRDQLPDGLSMLAFGIAGDLLRALPEAQRPSPPQLLSGLVELAKQRGGPIILHPLHDSSSGERVAWMNRITNNVEQGLRSGIDDRSVRPDIDVDEAVTEIIAAGVGIAYGWIVLPHRFDLPTELDRVRARITREYGA